MTQLDLYSSQIQDVYKALEDEIVSMFINKLNGKELDSKDFNIYSWHLSKLNELHQLNSKTVDKLAKATGISKDLINKMIYDSGYDIADSTSKSISNSLDTETKPVSSNVDDILTAMVNQTYSDFDNFVNQSMLATNFGQGSVLDAYQSILNNMVANVVSGLKTPRDALNNAIYDFMDSGLKSGFVDKAGRQWSLEAYIRTVLESTKYNVMNEARMGQAHEYGLHTFLMSSHAKSRPACAFIQGHVVNDVPASDPNFDKHFPTIYDYGYGEPGGTFGINCHHMKYPFIPGVNVNNQPQYDPQEAIKNGEYQQKQRQYERAIRNSKSKLNVAEQLGDVDGIKKYKQLIRNQQSALREYLKRHPVLNRDYSREKSYNRGITNAEKQSILKRSKINEQKNNRHYPGTYEYNEKNRIRKGKGQFPASILTASSDVLQKLIDKYGVKDMTTRTTSFEADRIIGYFIDQKTGKRIPTKWGLITYSKNGCHITPLDPRREHNNG